MRGLAVGRLRVARVERLDVGVAGGARVLHVVQHVVDAQARVDGPDVGVPAGRRVVGGERGGGGVACVFELVLVSCGLWLVACGLWLVGSWMMGACTAASRAGGIWGR